MGKTQWAATGTGATAGAIGGSTFGPAGTVIGGIGGALIGYGVGGIMEGQGTAGEMQESGYNFRDSDQMRGYQVAMRGEQGALADDMRRRALGGDTFAQRQLARTQEQNIASYNSAAQTARGGALSHVMAQRSAYDQAASARQQTAAQAQTLKAQEMLQGEQMAFGGYGQQRAGDMQTQGQDQARQLGIAQNYIGMAGVNASIRNQNTMNRTNENVGMVGAGGSMMGSAATGGYYNGGPNSPGGGSTTSDARAKVPHDASEAEIRGFLEAIDPQRFTYTREAQRKGAPPGERYGLLAQDIEHTKIGETMVHEDPETGYKVLDRDAELGAALAALASLHDRLDRLEGRR